MISIPSGTKLYNDHGKHVVTIVQDIGPLEVMRVEAFEMPDGTRPVAGTPVPTEVATAIHRELTKRRIDAAKAR